MSIHPWPPEHDALLMPLVEKGYSMSEAIACLIADHTGRSTEAVRCHLTVLRKRHGIPMRSASEVLLEYAQDQKARNAAKRAGRPQFAARKCLECRDEFTPPARHLFRCETCHKNEYNAGRSRDREAERAKA